MKCILLISAFLFISAVLSADETKPLFILQRNKNINELHYDVNIGTDGKINPKKPIVAYWIMLAEDGHREGFAIFEKRAYGFKCKYDKTKDVYLLVVNSFKKRVIEITGDINGVKTVILINEKPAYLDRLFITAKDSIPFPRVRSIELFGKNKITGEKVYEKIDI